jgi:hypothetical protein
VLMIQAYIRIKILVGLTRVLKETTITARLPSTTYAPSVPVTRRAPGGLRKLL